MAVIKMNLSQIFNCCVKEKILTFDIEEQREELKDLYGITDKDVSELSSKLAEYIHKIN